MGKSPEQLRLTPDERAELVAYMDGELPEAQARTISTKLTHSATARRDLEMLQKTWDLLDHLPKPKVDEQFAEKTVTNIQQLEIRASAWVPFAGMWGRWAAVGLLYLAVAAASLGAGYTAVRWVLPDRTERLVQELSLAEHLDEYLEVGSYDFLDELVKSQAFGLSTP